MSSMALYEKALLLKDLGYRICEIARALYPGVPAKKAWNRAYNLLYYAEKVKANRVNVLNEDNSFYESNNGHFYGSYGSMILSNLINNEIKLKMGDERFLSSSFSTELIGQSYSSVGRLGTLSRKFRKINVKCLEDRYFEELIGFVELLYNECEVYKFDRDKRILSYVKAVLKKKWHLISSEKIHVKRDYVKVTPKVAAVIYSAFFVSLFNLDWSKYLLNKLMGRLEFYVGLRVKNAHDAIKRELKDVMVEFIELIIPG